jgi:hypothetical protein
VTDPYLVEVWCKTASTRQLIEAIEAEAFYCLSLPTSSPTHQAARERGKVLRAEAKARGVNVDAVLAAYCAKYKRRFE